MITIGAQDVVDSLSNLKLRLKSILDFFDTKSRIFYIDYPIHNNIGDLLINLGTEQFFLNYHIPIYQRYSLLNMPDVSRFGDEPITILCQGGGNFGDLYPKHQDIREALIKNLPHARIIFLPQSLHYASQETQRIALARLAEYDNYHILARDKESFDALRQSGVVQSSMMPDMVHQLWGILDSPSPATKEGDIFFLRRDQEETLPPMELKENFAISSVDWDDIIPMSHRMLVGSIYHFLKAGNNIIPINWNTEIWYPMRDIVIRDAMNYFSRHDRVYTNRLHAMLLALLLGHDVVAFDNSYGKLSRYINAWLPEKKVDKIFVVG